MADCQYCQAMRTGYASPEAQLPCGHCPACCSCKRVATYRLEMVLREA